MAAVAVLLPFGAALVGMLFGPLISLVLPGRRNGPALVAVPATAAAAALTAVVAVEQWRRPHTLTGTLAVTPTGSLPFGVSLQVDGLSALVALMVCCVALAVQVYSVAYLRGDAHYSSYAAFVSLFTAAMLLVVLTGDLLVLYVGWEVMGICSYFLIGHHRHDRAASRAATKAFLVTRVGDAAFLFGVFTLGLGVHSFAIRDVLAHPPAHVTAGTLLLLTGVVAKSAQFPLHAWLPDAMVGPTPVSALIHAATMVAAGAYVVARLYPAFAAAPVTLAALGVIAAISMLGAALAALAQDDIKRLLAYSTISQLAYMAAGLSVGTRDGAVFHLVAHGAFKALLFLGAGCVVGTVGSSLMRDMGGLRLAMPVTFWSMTIGLAAQAGVPPASGFFSKDTILSQAWRATHAGHAWTAWLVLVTGLVTGAVTAAYATRAWLLTFFGEQRSAFEAREASPLLCWPVAALAVPALALGFAGLGSAALRPAIAMTVVSLLFTAAGGGAVFWFWNRDPALDPVRALGPLRPMLLAGFHADYDAVVRPVYALARLVAGVDERVVDAGVTGTGRWARRLGGLLRATENGNVQAYLSGLLAGVVLLVVAAVVLT